MHGYTTVGKKTKQLTEKQEKGVGEKYEGKC